MTETFSEQHGFRARRGELHQSCSNYFIQLSIVILCVLFYITMLNRFFMFIRSFVCVFVCFVVIPWSYISNFQEGSYQSFFFMAIYLLNFGLGRISNTLSPMAIKHDRLIYLWQNTFQLNGGHFALIVIMQ